MSVRILIADDHPVVRFGIQGMIARVQEFDLVGEVVNGDDALAKSEEWRPDVLILDINMPGLKAVKVIRQIQEENLPTRVLVMTSYADTGIVQAMLKAGATGYLLKDEDPSDVIDAIRAVAAGEQWLSPSLRPAVEAMNGANPKPVSGALNDREAQIGELIARGLTTKEIARSTNLAERTVEYNITQLFHKLGVSSRVELALWFQQNHNIGV